MIGTSKGRGFTGVVKRHGFPTRSLSHGNHESFRHGGAVSSGTFPGRIKKGLRMAGSLRRLARDPAEPAWSSASTTEKNLIYVRGGIPGHINGFVRIRPTVKD